MSPFAIRLAIEFQVSLYVAGSTGLALAKAIVPTRSVLRVLEVGADLFSEFTQCSGRLSTACTPIIEAADKGRGITFSQ
ncbi:hypothetical protein D3C76_1543980 [compost metagenome]